MNKKDSALQRMKTKIGTANYISPEVLNGDYGMDCDLWSAGTILYVMLSGCPPFFGEETSDILESVKIGKFDFDTQVWKTVSDDAKDLVSKLLCKPEDRLTAEQALNHKWLQSRKPPARNGIQITDARMKAFQQFSSYSKIKKAALTAISVQASPDDIKDLKELFQQLDKNGDGCISIEELEEGLQGKANGDKLI